MGNSENDYWAFSLVCSVVGRDVTAPHFYVPFNHSEHMFTSRMQSDRTLFTVNKVISMSNWNSTTTWIRLVRYSSLVSQITMGTQVIDAPTDGQWDDSRATAGERRDMSGRKIKSVNFQFICTMCAQSLMLMGFIGQWSLLATQW